MNKIYLSPSDQWSNQASGSGHSEAYHCAKIAEYAKKYLEYNGYSVKVGDNSKEETYPLRAAESNQWGADLHVCIHTNAGGGQGTEMMSYPTSVSNKYVEAIYKEVANLTPSADRGIKANTNLYEINATTAVCAYLEVEFHDNAELEKWIDTNLEHIGEAIASGIVEADGLEFLTGKKEEVTTTGSMYKVQAGAFASKGNATALGNTLTECGYGAYIYSDNGLYKVQVGAFASKENAAALVEKLKADGFDAFYYESK